jgi:hypothetical protein
MKEGLTVVLMLGVLATPFYIVYLLRKPRKLRSGTRVLDPFGPDKDVALMLSEATIEDRKAGLKARVDQVYEMPDGRLAVVDNKHRQASKVGTYEVVQLSVARAILMSAYDKDVQETGYVRLTGGNTVPRYVAVKLLPPREIHRLRNRYLKVSHGKVLPGANPGKACRTCDFACQYRAA